MLSCTHFGDQYTKEIIFGDKPFNSQSIIFVSPGLSAGWMRQSDRDRLGKYLSQEVKDHKVAAFITDAGGILSHAAITAREMKKPSIIGTQIATKVLRNGMIIEVNATKGIIKILKR